MYELTDDGEATAPLLFDLATFGTRYPAPEDVRRPGNLRTVAVTLREALRRVIDEHTQLHLELVVDDEPFGVVVSDGQVSVRYAPAPDAPLRIETNYEAMIAVADGAMPLAEFGKKHVSVVRGSQKAAKKFFSVMGKAFSR